jgi:2-polyprenyl-6-methoxyphenol hydroxylase-like FAD-dependent oxidoreductase
MAKSAIIVGGGIAGLSAGIALRQAGYDITLFEQASELVPVGAAISIWGNAMAGLDWLGCGEALRERAVPVRKVLLTQVDGRSLFGPVDMARSDGWLPLRSDLQDVLLARFGRADCRLGTRVEALVERGGRVFAQAGGETLAEADLAVAADGIHSRIATDLLGNAPVYRGYGAVMGIGVPPDDGYEPGLAQEIWAARDRFGLLDAGHGRRYWFYMAPFAHAEAIAAIGHAAIAERAQAWPGAMQAAVRHTAENSLIRIPICSRPTPRAMGRGRVICIGDAAHAIEPNQGQGGCQAIEDAWLLGLLARRLPPEALLAGFQSRRLPRVRGYWRDSALVGLAAHAPNRLQRKAGRALLAAAPRWLDRQQIARRHRPPHY